MLYMQLKASALFTYYKDTVGQSAADSRVSALADMWQDGWIRQHSSRRVVELYLATLS